MKKWAIATLGALLIASASARIYIGANIDTAVSSDRGNVVGAQVGNYTFRDHIGWRVQLESNFGVVSPTIFQLGADAMFTTGRYNIFYAGLGVGFANTYFVSDTLGGYQGLYIGPFIGADLDTDSNISVFGELSPRFYPGATTNVNLRLGANVHLGASPYPEDSTAAAPASAAVANPNSAIPTPVTSTTDSSSAEGRVTPAAAASPAKPKEGEAGSVDRNGNVFLEPWQPGKQQNENSD